MTKMEPAASTWQSKRTDESRMVEEELGKEFANVDAYRHNSASLRVRIMDERFRSLDMDERDALVHPELTKLPDDTQADIINLVLMYPGEDRDERRIQWANTRFEHPDFDL